MSMRRIGDLSEPYDPPPSMRRYFAWRRARDELRKAKADVKLLAAAVKRHEASLAEAVKRLEAAKRAIGDPK